jgi:hypothetical protein
MALLMPTWPELKTRLTTWDDWGKPIFYGTVITLTGFFVLFGGRPDLVGREFNRCNSDHEVFISNTYGYSLCIPRDWEGKYGTINADHEIDFVYTDGQSAPILLFAVTVLPRPYWDQVRPARGTWEEIARDDNHVFAALNYRGEDPNTASEEYKKLSRSVPRILRTIVLSSYKSVNDVIDENLTRLAVKPHGGQAFVAYELLGRDELEDGKYKYYVWFYSQEYYEQGGQVQKGAEMSVPVSLHVTEDGANFVIGSFEAPRSGEDFFPDVKRIFPERIATSEWFNPDLEYLNEHVDVLKAISLSRAKDFYKDKFPTERSENPFQLR